MNDSENTNPLPTDPVHNPVMPYDQFTYGLVLIFWNNTP
jgi:hypothetical protein